MEHGSLYTWFMRIYLYGDFPYIATLNYRMVLALNLALIPSISGQMFVPLTVIILHHTYPQ